MNTAMTHIDDWLDDDSNRIAHPIAWNFFAARRRPAIEQLEHPYYGKLFCEWRKRRYRVTGCSRLGDVWLAKDLKRDCGYDYRVDVCECSDWSELP